MDSCTPGGAQEVCWFCRKGRHDDCMAEIPMQERSEGPHDCTFGTRMVPCRCDVCAESARDSASDK